MNATSPRRPSASASATPISRPTPPYRRPNRKAGLAAGKLIAVLVGLVLLGGGGYLAYRSYGASDAVAEELITDVVRRGPLLVTATEAGEIEAERKKIIRNEVSRHATIVSLVDEGTRVKEGDTVIEFECQDLLDRIDEVKTQLDANQVYYDKAVKDLELKKKELDHELAKAKDSLVDAEGALKRYVEGEGPLSLKEYQSRVSLAERDLMLAREKLEFKQRVNSDPALNSPYSESEIKADKLTVSRLELSVEQSKSDLTMFKAFDHPRRIRQLEASVRQSELNLERAKEMAVSQRMIAETDKKSRYQNLQKSKQKLEELLKYKDNLIVEAEADGLVAYDTGRGWRAEQTTVAVGESIRPWQQLMIIPDMTSLQIRTRVYEAVISMIEVGQTAVIRLDSKPEKAMPGTVAKVDVLPSSQHRWLNPGVKVFDVVVKFDNPEDIKDLKPGLTAQVKIEMRRLEDVLSVPIAAVFTEQEETFCRVVRHGHIETVPVTVGLSNETHCEIRGGLSEGEEVLLVTPTGGSQESNGEKKNGSEEPASPDAPVGGGGQRG